MSALALPAAPLPPPDLPADYRPRLPLQPTVVVELDCRERGGVYVSTECQLGVHHGCPTGIRETGGGTALVCRCPWGGCACYREPHLYLLKGGRS